ncbi:MAG: FAD-dependent oxidoreductase [Luteolibacter sp.]|uniref:NAD(P)/FAD-dependent oxidoreductase n=1 Tax=Luteolibacter sp. TaxID=1962973 RepID=UPI0032661327
MKREKIAIVGSGISGMACAHFLNRDHDITVFEKDDRVGGHSHTVMVDEGGTTVPVDTGFMVYNEVTYPLLTRLFRELDVATKPTSMSFSVQNTADRLEFNGGSVNLLFGQRRNLFNLRYWRMLLQIARFNRETVEELSDPKFGEMTLCDYVKARGYGRDFLKWYLSPMAAAVWSSPPERIDEFPARTLMRFWHNHGFLGLDTQHPWRTVDGGSRSYVEKLTAPFKDRIHQGAGILAVNGSTLKLEDGTERVFDRVVIAAHGDQALRMLSDPTDMENELLEKFNYQENVAVLHTDPKFMPKTRRCWAAWNYRIDGDGSHSTHYWMNELQGVSDREQYFVSINPPSQPAEASIKRRLVYEHPLFDLAAISAQQDLPRLHQVGRETNRYFCGAWQRYGFHEDGLWSAVNVCTEILGRDPWS